MMQYSPNSRVWVYQCDRLLTDMEQTAIQTELDMFIKEWLAHGNALSAKATIYYNAFIVIMVDETKHAATGCSIDSSVRMLKNIEQKHGLDLFNRFNLAYRNGEDIVIVPKETFETLLQNNTLNAETIVFNNMVQNLKDFEDNWEVPIKQSWHNHVFAEYLK